jgi:hypothetical protein
MWATKLAGHLLPARFVVVRTRFGVARAALVALSFRGARGFAIVARDHDGELPFDDR